MGLVPIKAGGEHKACTLSGMQGKIFSQELIRLRDTEKALIVSIQEAESALTREAFWGKAVIAAKFTKLASDLTLWVMSNVPGAGMGATAVTMIYDRATLVSDILATPQNAGATLGQAVGEAHVDILSNSLKHLGKEKAGMLIDSAKVMIKAQLAIDDMIDNAKDNKGSGSGILAAKKMLLNQLQNTRIRISSLHKRLHECGIE